MNIDWNNPTIQVAVIGVFSAIIVVVLTALLTWHNTREERRKLRLESEKLEAELKNRKSLFIELNKKDTALTVRNGKFLPLVCFEIIAANFSETKARASAALGLIIVKVLSGIEDVGNWTVSTRGTNWFIISENNDPKGLIELSARIYEEIDRRSKQAQASAQTNGKLSVRAAFHCGSIFAVQGVQANRWELFGEGIEFAIELASVGAEGHLLCSEGFAEMVRNSPEYRSHLKSLSSKYKIVDKEVNIYNLLKGNMGNPSEPPQKRVYREWRHSLSYLLKRINAVPNDDIQKLFAEVGEDALAIDDVVSLVETPKFSGWRSMGDIEVKIAKSPSLVWPDNWNEIVKQYGLFSERGKSFPKVYIDKWDPYIIDQGGKLTLHFGRTTFSQNKALEKLFANDIEISLNGSKTTLKKLYATRTPDGTPLFWQYLPNVVYMSIVIVTSDSQLLLIRRSSTVTYYPNHWSVSIEEMLDPTQDFVGEDENQDAIFERAIRRGIKEELGEQVELASIKILGLYREYPQCNVSVIALARVRQTATMVAEFWKTAEDKAEGRYFDYRPFELENLIDALANPTYVPWQLSKNLSHKYHGGARLRLLLAGLAEFDQDKFRQVLMQKGGL